MEVAKMEFETINVDLVENGSSGSLKSKIPNFKKESSFSSCDDANCNAPNGNESSPMPMYNKQKRFRNAWGNLSYANLIAAAILSSHRKKMKLSEIYAWFVANVPYFAQRDDELKSRGWKNSIRHNLSLKREFVRESGDKKAGYWFIDKDLFIQRLHSENRQINDPVYNKDMEIFESFVLRSFASAEWNDRFLKNNQTNRLKDDNIYYNGYNCQMLNFPEINTEISNFTQPSGESDPNSNIDAAVLLPKTDANPTGHVGYTAFDSNQPISTIPKTNPFGALSSSDQNSANNLQWGSNGISVIPVTTQSFYSNGSTMDKYMIYSPSTVVDNRYGQPSQMVSQFPIGNGGGIDMQQLILQSNLGQNQYYTLANVGLPMQSQDLFRESSYGGFYQHDNGLQSGNLNNRVFTHGYPIMVKPDQTSQGFQNSIGHNTEPNKSLVN